jgi:hypothetical protein
MIQLKSVFGLIWTVKRTSKNGQFRTKQKQKKRVGLKCNAKLSTANPWQPTMYSNPAAGRLVTLKSYFSLKKWIIVVITGLN